MKLQKLTPEQIRQENREYNAQVWDNTINRFLKYADIQFYVARKDEIYAYDRYFATYTIEEGLKLMNSVSYSSMISNSGFTRVYIHPETGEITKTGFGPEGKDRVINNKQGRKWLVDNLCKHGVIVTND